MTILAEITLTESHPELLGVLRGRIELADLSMRFGTTRPGAQNHQDGETLPRRTFLIHQPEDVQDYIGNIADWILGRFPFEGSDRSQLDAALYTIMAASAVRNFDEQGRPESWPALAESTLQARRNRNKMSVTILVDTGLLRGSIAQVGAGTYSVREVS